MKRPLAILLTLCSAFCILHLNAATNRLGSVKATQYVVTSEDDPTVPSWAKAANPPATGLTTNDVCAIVTNDMAATDWVTNITATSGGKEVTLLNVKWGYGDNPDEWMMKLNVPGIGEAWRPCAAPNNTDTNATTLAASEYPELVTTRTLRHNALGLAYERDIVPAVTNTVTKDYVNALGISAGLTTNDVDGIIASSNLASVAYVETKRDLTNNVAAADGGFTPWVVHDLPDGYMVYSDQPTWDSFVGYWFWVVSSPGGGSLPCTDFTHDKDATHLTLSGYSSESFTFTATRARIAYLNDVYTTYTFVTNAVANSADKATVNALVTTTATHTATIAGWETYWSGDKVRLSVTNYYGNTSGELPRLRIEESQTNTQGVVTNWVTVWDEENRHTNYQATVDAKVDGISNTVIVAAWKQTNAQLSDKAPRAWGTVTSAGTKAPNNVVWHTAPNTVFAGGTEYAHVAVGEGTISVLRDYGSPVYTEGEEGKFRFTDDSGNFYFGFDVTDGYTIGCRTDGISSPIQNPEDSHWLVDLTYDLTASDPPTILSTTNLSATAEWTQYPATWDTTTTPGVMVASLDLGTTPPGQRFFKAQISVSSAAKFVTNMQADLAGGIAASNEVLNVIQNVYPVITSTGVVWRVKN